jgi:WD40 repeat protein
MARALSRGDEHGAEIVAREIRPVQAVKPSPDNGSLAIGVEDQRAWLWRLSDGEPIRSFDDHRGWVTALAFAPDGSLLVSGADDGDARFWRPGDGSLVRFVRSPKELPFPEQAAWSVNAVAMSPDGQMLATAGEDGPIWLWSVPDGQLVGVLEGHASDVTSLAFSGDGVELVSGAWDHTVRLWRVQDRALLSVLTVSDVVLAVAASPRGDLVAGADDDGLVRVWSAADGSLRQTLGGHTGAVRAVRFSPDGQRLATGSDDGSLRLWSTADGTTVRTFAVGAAVSSLAFSSDASFVVTGSSDGAARVWSLR